MRAVYGYFYTVVNDVKKGNPFKIVINLVCSAAAAVRKCNYSQLSRTYHKILTAQETKEHLHYLSGTLGHKMGHMVEAKQLPQLLVKHVIICSKIGISLLLHFRRVEKWTSP